MVKSGIDEQSNEELTKQLNKLWRKINERCKPGAPKPPPFKNAPINGLILIIKLDSNRITGLIKVSLAHLLIMHLKFFARNLNSWYPLTKLTQGLTHHEVT